MSAVGISTKWPAARLLGPSVEVDLALEFIRRTDPALCGSGFTNNRYFMEQLLRLIGVHEQYAPGSWEYTEAFSKAFGHVSLEHLGSRWVASSFIGGPNGPVSPSGRVMLAVNFGKWPSVEEIERDLTALAANFAWLAFDLSVWGQSEEGDEGLPSHTWRLENGEWSSIAPKELKVSEPDTITSFMANFSNPMREQTWSIDQIERMWGSQIAEARLAASTPPRVGEGK